MTILVTGANGQLGRLVVADLLESGVAAGDIVATALTNHVFTELAGLTGTVSEGIETEFDIAGAPVAQSAIMKVRCGLAGGGQQPLHQGT